MEETKTDLVCVKKKRVREGNKDIIKDVGDYLPIAAVLLFGLLFLYVVPAFGVMFKEMNVTLPPITKNTLWLAAHPYMVLALVVLLTSILFFIIRHLQKAAQYESIFQLNTMFVVLSTILCGIFIVSLFMPLIGPPMIYVGNSSPAGTTKSSASTPTPAKDNHIY